MKCAQECHLYALAHDDEEGLSYRRGLQSQHLPLGSACIVTVPCDAPSQIHLDQTLHEG